MDPPHQRHPSSSKTNCSGMPLAPYTRDSLSDPPPVFQSIVVSPKPHRTPPYAYGWRLTLDELREGLAHYGPQYDTVYLSTLRYCIKEQWKAQKCAAELGANSCPNALPVPYREDDAELEAFVCLFMNSSKKDIARSQDQAQAQQVISAARKVLRLGKDADKTLKWHCMAPFEPYKHRV
ncbi:hypothetical protein ONZ45_g12684 [Pleurotus djamor]|nr:hypothetical protein ONZ45_g12684 [Pleurotus djamor]